ncbi:MAG TPA: hypothetical protein PKW33_19950, partial [Anaerolineaceae bacterium]|nr:hypothetical protein [Anaerolineaceae bacterium]HPN53879.1 hypothetical protein [Anaerolineaceae bacterium]
MIDAAGGVFPGSTVPGLSFSTTTVSTTLFSEVTVFFTSLTSAVGVAHPAIKMRRRKKIRISFVFICIDSELEQVFIEYNTDKHNMTPLQKGKKPTQKQESLI